MSLASRDTSAHLTYNVVQDPERREAGEDKVGAVVSLRVPQDSARHELVETSLVADACSVDEKADDPSDEPARRR